MQAVTCSRGIGHEAVAVQPAADRVHSATTAGRPGEDTGADCTPLRTAEAHPRVDNGPEFISNELDLWAWLHEDRADLLAAGKPTDNPSTASSGPSV